MCSRSLGVSGGGSECYFLDSRGDRRGELLVLLLDNQRRNHRFLKVSLTGDRQGQALGDALVETA